MEFGCKLATGRKFNTSPWTPMLAVPGTGLPLESNMRNEKPGRKILLNAKRGTEDGSICTALLLGKMESKMGGVLSAVVNSEVKGAAVLRPTRSVGPLPVVPS